MRQWLLFDLDDLGTIYIYGIDNISWYQLFRFK